MSRETHTCVSWRTSSACLISCLKAPDQGRPLSEVAHDSKACQPSLLRFSLAVSLELSLETVTDKDEQIHRA